MKASFQIPEGYILAGCLMASGSGSGMQATAMGSSTLSAIVPCPGNSNSPAQQDLPERRSDTHIHIELSHREANAPQSARKRGFLSAGAWA
jgi:hypothetical protein